MLYNEELKKKYIEYCITQQKAVESIQSALLKVSSYEEEYDKDAGEFSADEILDFAKKSGLTCRSLTVYISHIKHYAEWYCITQEKINHYKEIAYRDLQEVSSDCGLIKRIDRETLLNLTEFIDNARLSYILLGLFEGIPGDSLYELGVLKKENIHVSRKCFTLSNGAEIQISIELLKYAIKACDEYEGDLDVRNRRRPYLNVTNVIKPYFNAGSDYENPDKVEQRMRSILRAGQKELNEPGLTQNALREAGAVHHMKKIMSEKGITIKELFRNPIVTMPEVLYRFNYKAMSKSRKGFKHKFDKYLIE